MAEPLTLPQAFLDEMVAHARQDDPSECCGVIGRFPDGSLKLYRATNAYRSLDALLGTSDTMQLYLAGDPPRQISGQAGRLRFSIPPEELFYLYRAIEGDGGQMLVIYHSHTMTEARPSATDLKFAANFKGSDPWPFWVLVSLAEEPPSVRAWRIDDAGTEGAVQPTEIALVAGSELPASSRVRLRSTVTEVPLAD